MNSDSIDVTIVSVPKKGKVSSKRFRAKFSLKEHMEACGRRFAEGVLVKVQVQANAPEVFPVGEADAKSLKTMMAYLDNIDFWVTELDKKRHANAGKAKEVVNLIVGDIRIRSGLGDSWDGIDDHTKNEIRQEWQAMLERVL